MEVLIKRILSGEVEAFREIIEEYNSSIRIYFASRIYDPQTVDDLTQEVFIAVYENLKKFDASRNFRNWILGFAANKAKSYFRKQKNKRTAYEKLIDHINQNVLSDEENDEMSSPVSHLEECLKRLPDRAKNILRSRFYENEKVKDIADAYKMSVDALSALIYRSKKKLSDCLQENN